MDKTFSNTFRKAFSVAAFVSLAVMAAVTGAAMFQLYVTGQRYARLRDYATEQGIKLAGSSDKPLFSIKSGSAPELADCLEERLVGTYGLSDCALEIRGESLMFTGNLSGGFSQAKTAFPFASSDESDNYDPYYDYYDSYYYERQFVQSLPTGRRIWMSSKWQSPATTPRSPSFSSGRRWRSWRRVRKRAVESQQSLCYNKIGRKKHGIRCCCRDIGL